MVAGVEKLVESDLSGERGDGPAVQIRLLGQVSVRRDGVLVELPASRKVRALLAYLALSPAPVPRGRLCELLWDIPNDPRSELRWCLSKLRRILDSPGRRRIQASADSIRLDLDDCFVDAIEIIRATQQGLEPLGAERLRDLLSLFVGELLDGLEIDRNPEFNAWLTAERRRFAGRRVAILEQILKSAAEHEVFGYLEQWLQLAPFDRHAHEILLGELARRGRIPEGEKHVAATVRLFEAEGLDASSVRNAWRSARAQPGTSISAPSVSTPETAASEGEKGGACSTARRASIAVMPFTDRTCQHGGWADGIAHDLITRLAKLRSLFVIAQGSVFALQERGVAAADAGRILNVDYVVTGSVQRRKERVVVGVELAETRTARVVWAETIDHKQDDALLMLDEIGDRLVASIESEIEAFERNRAILKPPNSLDAWEAYHRGLWHVYRFDKSDNDQARHFFEMALRLDPTFARAHAGLSFFHFQNAFQGWAPREIEIDRAYESAGQSLMADDRDPAAHWAMGRALWLRGRQEQSVVELEKVVELSPNYAMGHYMLAFVNSQAGDALAAIESADYSRHLSPFDPMLFGILGSRAMALVRLGRYAEAAEWGVKAAARPNAHPHILAIAAYSLALIDSPHEARIHVEALRKVMPQYSIADFLGAFKFDAHGEALFRKAAARIGLA